MELQNNEKLKDEYISLVKKGEALKKINSKYSHYFPKPNGCEKFEENFYQIGKIICCSQSGIDVMGKNFNTTYFHKI